MKKLLLACLATLLSIAAFAQTGTVKGRIVDGANGEGLVGANVVLKDKIAVGAMTDINGNFTINNVEAGKQIFVVSFIGFIPKEVEATVKAGSVTDLGSINVAADAIGLKEVEVMASIAQDRKTPVAVSTVKADFIEAKIGSQEFPEILKTTPGVYVTRQGGGFGDASLRMRGFNSENVAVMINGVPVNDMENGRVYWSNWAGMTDVTRFTQVQRGLGASKVAVPSIGGTMNIITKTTDAEKGGSVFYGVGNNGYSKKAISFSTGLTDDNWAVTLLGAHVEGEGWADATSFEGYSYFLNVSKMINDQHQISFTGFGAPQWHGQRQSRLTIADYRLAPQGIRYNPDWGYLNGQVVNVEDNFYHKPQFSLNHYWTMSDRTELSTAAYASIGTGGGGGTGGNTAKFAYRNGNAFSPIDLDRIYAENVARADLGSETILRASRNDHKWYGVLSSLNHELNENINLMGGLDFRYYKGEHFQEVTNLLGGNYYVDKANINNPINIVREGDIFSYHNDGIVLWEGAFAQAEYALDRVSAFVSLAASNTSYKRIDYFNYLDTDPQQETEFVNFFGYSGKGGVNYNLTERHNIFANAGYFERAPFMNSVFLRNQNIINEQAENQKITSFELGYGYRSSIFSANVNAYRTQWNDRSFVRRYFGAQGEDVFANILGVNALHQGIELDFNYRPVSKLRITGMASFGDWTWLNNVENVEVFDANQNLLATIDIFIAGLKVGDAAQTTAALSADYEIVKDFTIGTTYNYYGNLYADYEPTDRANAEYAGFQSWKMPDFHLFDLNMAYNVEVAGLKASIYGNVNNLFNVEYLSDAVDNDSRTGYQYDAATAGVYYGIGRTWTLGTKVRF